MLPVRHEAVYVTGLRRLLSPHGRVIPQQSKTRHQVRSAPHHVPLAARNLILKSQDVDLADPPLINASGRLPSGGSISKGLERPDVGRRSHLWRERHERSG